MKIDKDLQKQAFSARLEEAAKAADLNYYGHLSDLARHFKMSVPGVRKWFTAEVIPLQKIEELAAYYRVRPEWLRSGKGAMKEVQGVSPDGESQKVEIHNVPILQPEQWPDFKRGGADLDLPKVLATGKLQPGCFAIQVLDNSLVDRVLKGMYVVVSPHETPGPSDLAVAYINGSFVAGALVKRDTVTIIPPNSNFRPVDLGADPEICGVMISIVQQNLKQ